MKTFKHRGKTRVVGTVKHPSKEALEEQAKKGTFGDAAILPAPPISTNYIENAQAGLCTMLGNGPDSTLPVVDGVQIPPVGDCFVAMDLHLASERAGNAGNPFTPTTAEAIQTYSAVTGYVPGDQSTDQGTNPLAMIAYRKAGNAYPDGSVLVDAINVDATNRTQLQTAIWLAVGCMAWASLPDEWESEENGGSVWDVAGPPNPENGHGFGLGDFDQDYIYLVEWAEDELSESGSAPIKMTYAAAAKYLVPSAGGGVLAPIDSDAISSMTSKCPAGFDVSTLENYLRALGAPAASPSTPPPSSDQGAA
jgi:hypothetical protein